MSGLLVSVRSATEARAALAGGATLIDVKEPSRGTLGRADREVIEAVLVEVDGRVPVSAALGELEELGDDLPFEGLPLSYLKWGFKDSALTDNLVHRCERKWERVRERGQGTVAVAYADAVVGREPGYLEVVAMACGYRCDAMLFDTMSKDGRTLLDFIEVGELMRLTAYLHQHEVKVALAGSLGIEQIALLRDVNPDWFAVRGAACEGGRDGAVSADRVKALVEAASR